MTDQFPFRSLCDDCAEERLHHHTGSKTKGMPHEALNYYCWCLDEQPPLTCVHGIEYPDCVDCHRLKRTV